MTADGPDERQQQIDLGRSLLVAVMIRLIRERTQPAFILLTVLAVGAAVGAFLLDDWLRGALIAVTVIAAVVLLFGLAIRRIATFGIAKLAPPADIEANQDVLDQAVDDLGLPLGPISTPKFAFRLRKGVDAEIDRMAGVLADLVQDLDR